MTQPAPNPQYGNPSGAPSFVPNQYEAQPSPYMPQSYSVASPQAPGYIMPTEPVKKSPVMGIIGLALVVVAAVVYYICWQAIYDGVFHLIQSGAWEDSTSIYSLSPEQLAQFKGFSIGILLSSMAGLGGLVVSIVATAQDRGRPYGITGIVLGALAPFLIFLAAIVAYGAVFR